MRETVGVQFASAEHSDMRNLRYVVLSVFIFVISAFNANHAEATLFGRPTLQESIDCADLVLVGRIIAEKSAGLRSLDYMPGWDVEFTIGTILVEKVLQGESPCSSVQIHYESQSNTTASVNYTLGQEGVWILVRRPDTSTYDAYLKGQFVSLDRLPQVEQILKATHTK